MPKKDKEPKKAINWFRIGVLAVRTFGAFILMYFGYWIWAESGDRIFNKYLHSLRKMALPTSKPSTEAALGMTFEDVN